MSKYIIHDQQFKTKKECLEYTRALLNAMPVCLVRRGDKNFLYLSALIEKHPNYEEKIGCGLDFFSVENGTLNKTSKHLNIYRVDGSVESISWNNCCKFSLNCEYNPKMYLTQAMRTTIAYDTLEYKKNADNECALCKSREGSFETDHIYPFSKIRDEFLATCQTEVPTTFSKCPTYYNTKFKEEDKEFENEWLSYHTAKRSYQILCKNCNGTKGAKIGGESAGLSISL